MAKDIGPRQQQTRALIAQTAARLIVEHGLNDWNRAKRKAARELGISEREGLPTNEDVERALFSHQSLFRAETQPEKLRQQRLRALVCMEKLVQFKPVLIDGVAAGWATEHSEIKLEVIADDPKLLEIFLLNQRMPFTVLPGHSDRPSYCLSEESVQLEVLSPMDRRQISRRRSAVRFEIDQLRSVLNASQ